MLSPPLLINPFLIIIIHIWVIEKIIIGKLCVMALNFCVTFSFIIFVIIRVKVDVVIKRLLVLF